MLIMHKPTKKSSAKAESKKATKIVKAKIQEAKAIDVTKAPKKKIALKDKVLESKRVLNTPAKVQSKPSYLPNELRPGSLISINNYKPNKKGHVSAQIYEVKEPAKDGIVTGLNVTNPHIKIKAYAIIHDGIVRFPGLGRYTHVGFLINPNKK